MTANFLSPDDGKLESLCLCLEQVDFPHDSETCVEAANNALQKFGINSLLDDRIGFLVTDNGSNMKKAYSNLKSQNGLEVEQFEFLDQDAEEETYFQVGVKKRLVCAAHALSNSLNSAINGSKRKQIQPCLVSQNMLQKVLSIARKVIV